LEYNVKAGNNYQDLVEFLDSTNTVVFKAGDKLKFEIVGTPDAAVTELKAFLVDNSEAGSWWTTLSGYANSGSAGVKDTEGTFVFEMELTKAPSSAEPAACKLGVYCDAEGNGVTNIAVSSFKVTKE